MSTAGRHPAPWRSLGRRLGPMAWRHLGEVLRRPREYEDLLRRLVRGSFADLDAGERARRVEQIVQLSASAAMAAAVAPLPLLELPVQAAMVRAIARVHGVEGSGRKLLLQLLASLGGGLALRQAARWLPVVGTVPFLSRVYGTTWALGQAADVYFRRDARPRPGALREVYAATARRKTHEQRRRLVERGGAARLRELRSLHAEGLITDREYARKRGELLDSL